ncbi:duplicated orphan permease [Mucilaginibacter lappiensis]|uniref:Permease n=1 Tax=Mucilaginibacter lappiensis TaxID=354630 RepID=A0ABR6PH68_9SPHI|nr:ABC transporter permease [Mucilaginibacter lappiensis]MBB6108996.1 putative permease [Mucilaginibacter lappiensis]SIQ71131.1 duplicated orphan permease [Mucilaginibacter lappiensis]
MLKNYIKTAIRNLTRHKSNAVINIAGLTVGFAAFLLIFLVVQYEQSFDSFHTKKDKIYRVVRIGKNPVNREYRTGVPVPVTSTIRTELPEVANAAAIVNTGDMQVIVTPRDGSALKKFKEASGFFFAEPQFFQIFDFPLVEGDIKTALTEPNTILLTKASASKYFGSWQGIIGKTLKMDGEFVKVTGVLENPPANTDFPIKGVLSYITLFKADNKNWGGINDGNYCFVELAKNHTVNQLSRALSGFTDRHIKPINSGYNLSPQALNELHYDERYGNFTGRTFSKDLILALSLIGLFLLIVACVNFINLTVAQAVNRAREVGVRKVLGGSRSQLIAQFLGETGITSLLAMLISLVIVVIALPAVNNLLEINLTASTLYSPRLVIFLFGALLLVSFLSGFYPALVLSGFKPASILKGSSGADQKQGVMFRRGLVVFQFVIAQTLIIGTLVVASQMDYFRTANMGFKKDAVIYATFPRDSVSRTKVSYLRDQLAKIPGVEKVGFSMFSPVSDGGFWATDLNREGHKGINPDMIVNMKIADPDFFSVYNLPIVAGRIYFASDTMREFVVNETVVRRLGIRSPKDAIGMPINVGGRTLPIVGVVKDFHANSLRDPIEPLVMSSLKKGYGLANLRIDLSKAKSITAAMENVWDKNFPEFILEYKFMDQTIANYYKQENQLSALYTIFSGIAIFISCLGLYGLISFMAIQRKKEIGIRKVLGAPVKDIVILLSKEFTMLVIIAFLIASPLAWYFMHQWLQGYTYHIIIGIWFFVATILASVCIAWLTVGYTAIKAALANPVKSLRTE